MAEAVIRKHAVLPPSAARRWGLCHVSPLLSRGVPSKSSEAAALGSKAHRAAELRLKAAFSRFVGAAPEPDEAEKKELDALPDDFKQYVEKYVGYVKSRYLEDKDDTTIFAAVEQRLPVGLITGEAEAFGTADFLAVTQDRFGINTLHVVDFKTGQEPVSAFNNEQLFIYGAAALRLLPTLNPFLPEVGLVCLTIVQPSVGDDPNWWSLGVNSFSDDADFIQRVRKAAARSLALYEGRAEIEESDWPTHVKPEQLPQFCKYCPGLFRCSYFVKHVDKAIEEVDGAAALVVQQSIPVPTTPEQLAKAYGYLPLIKQWCDAVGEQVYLRLMNGEAVPGWKAVAGRAGVRRWADEGAAEKELRGVLKKSEAFEEKLISPTKAEKLHKEGKINDRRWERIQSLVMRSETKPSIVPESDPRPSLRAALADEFEDLTKEKSEK